MNTKKLFCHILLAPVTLGLSVPLMWSVGVVTGAMTGGAVGIVLVRAEFVERSTKKKNSAGGQTAPRAPQRIGHKNT